MLRTGNNFVVRKRITKKAFTLSEVMVTTAVLSLGIVLVYEAFFSSLNSFNYCCNYLNLSPWADDKIWQAQDNLNHFGPPDDTENEGEIIKKNKSFKWCLLHNLIDKEQGLYRIELALCWQEGQRNVKLLRTAYAVYTEK